MNFAKHGHRFYAIFLHLLACFGNSFFLSNFFNFWQCTTTIIFTMLPCNNVNAFVILAAPPNLNCKSSGCTSKEDILLHKQSQLTNLIQKHQLLLFCTSLFFCNFGLFLHGALKCPTHLFPLLGVCFDPLSSSQMSLLL